MSISDIYSIFLRYPSVQTDTRKIKRGDIFIALKGPNFNANNFALQALEQGAAYAVVDEDIDANNEQLIRVDDVLTTLQQLAKHHRQQFSIPFIAITGSNGKTTTKELVSTVLVAKYKTYTTQGNLNNHIGVPLTLLSIKQDAEMAVIEMGANHQKEIEGYCSYALPTHGIITNIGKAHLEGFGGVEGIKKGKGELFDFLRENEGTAFVYNESDDIKALSNGLEKIYSYGINDADVMGIVKHEDPFLEVELSNLTVIKTQLVGGYNLPNALCAVAVGRYFKVSDEEIKVAIENYAPSNSRSQLIQKDSNTIILDAYNANPASMKVAIENFAKIKAVNKVLLLGGMMELGEYSLQEHEQIVALLKDNKLEKVVLVGGDFSKIQHPFFFFSKSVEAAEWFKEQHFTNTHILIKGSRSMQMEKVLEN